MKSNKITTEFQIAELLRKQMSYKKISETLHTSSKRISYVAKHLKEFKSIPPPKQIGPPIKVNSDIISEIDIVTAENPHTGGIKLAKHILLKLGCKISATTINKLRAMLHNSFKNPRK